jgi:hypothetical protein
VRRARCWSSRPAPPSAVAKDTKLQIEWNPARVARYRLIGYDNRRLADEAFNDDAKDAGEMGDGHTVTAFDLRGTAGVCVTTAEAPGCSCGAGLPSAATGSGADG